MVCKPEVHYKKNLQMIFQRNNESNRRKNLGVYIQATHGCVENRGVQAHSSLTQTTVIRRFIL
jgi:GTP cyclohydrolase I